MINRKKLSLIFSLAIVSFPTIADVFVGWGGTRDYALRDLQSKTTATLVNVRCQIILEIPSPGSGTVWRCEGESL